MLYLSLVPSVRFWLKPQKLTNPLGVQPACAGTQFSGRFGIGDVMFDRVKKIEQMCSLFSKQKQMPGKYSLGWP